MPLFNTKTLSGLDRWFVRFDEKYDDPDECEATIYIPIQGRHDTFVGVATVDCVPTEIGEYGERMPVSSGDDSERLKYVALIKNAPELMCVCMRALKRIREKLEKESDELAKADRPTWILLCEIERELIIALERATDLDEVACAVEPCE